MKTIITWTLTFLVFAIIQSGVSFGQYHDSTGKNIPPTSIIKTTPPSQSKMVSTPVNSTRNKTSTQPCFPCDSSIWKVVGISTGENNSYILACIAPDGHSCQFHVSDATIKHSGIKNIESFVLKNRNQLWMQIDHCENISKIKGKEILSIISFKFFDLPLRICGEPCRCFTSGTDGCRFRTNNCCTDPRCIARGKCSGACILPAGHEFSHWCSHGHWMHAPW